MKTLNLFFIIAIILLVGADAFADVKIRTRNTTAGQTFESTVYIKGKRQRSEQNFGGVKTVTLTQCDLRRDVRLNEQAKTYFLSLYAAEGAGVENSNQSATQNQKSAIEKGGTITTVITLKDTGERKQIFGYTARRILSTIVTESSADACSPVKSRMETDGWYIDADFALDCFTGAQYKAENSSQSSGCRDRQIFKRNGSAKLGYPVYLKTTMRGDADSGEDFVTVQEVLEISPAALDAALFEIPAGFREVKNQAELFTGGAMRNDVDEDEEDSDEDEEEKPKKSGSNVKTQAKNETVASVKTASQTPANLPVTVGAKKSGVVRVGLANVKTGSVGEGMNAGELSAAVKNSLAEFLKGTNVELVQIEAKLPLQIKEEAKQKAVDFVIYVTVSHKKGGGGFGKVFGKIATIAADVAPGATGDATANAAIYAGKEAVYTAADAAGNVKSKDELTLEIRMETTDASVLTKQFKTKAKSDGEDIITPLIEQAAQAIVDAAAKAGK